MTSIQRLRLVVALGTGSGVMSTPLRHMKPPAHSLKLAVIPPSAKVVSVPGTNKAQVPAHTLAPSSAVVGAALTVKAVV